VNSWDRATDLHFSHSFFEAHLYHWLLRLGVLSRERFHSSHQAQISIEAPGLCAGVPERGGELHVLSHPQACYRGEVAKRSR